MTIITPGSVLCPKFLVISHRRTTRFVASVVRVRKDDNNNMQKLIPYFACVWYTDFVNKDTVFALTLYLRHRVTNRPPARNAKSDNDNDATRRFVAEVMLKVHRHIIISVVGCSAGRHFDPSSLLLRVPACDCGKPQVNHTFSALACGIFRQGPLNLGPNFCKLYQNVNHIACRSSASPALARKSQFLPGQ